MAGVVASASVAGAGVDGAADPASDTGAEKALASEAALVPLAAAPASLAGVDEIPKNSDQSDDADDEAPALDDEAPALDDEAPALYADPSLPLLLSLCT